MGIALIILLIIFLLWPIIGPRIMAFFGRFAQRRAEDMMRRMMGMPSRKEEKKRKKRAERNAKRYSRSSSSDRRRHPKPKCHAAQLLNSVAEDVEFTEIKEFHSETIHAEQSSGRVYREEQVSDVEYTEIRTTERK